MSRVMRGHDVSADSAEKPVAMAGPVAAGRGEETCHGRCGHGMRGLSEVLVSGVALETKHILVEFESRVSAGRVQKLE